MHFIDIQIKVYHMVRDYSIMLDLTIIGMLLLYYLLCVLMRVHNDNDWLASGRNASRTIGVGLYGGDDAPWWGVPANTLILSSVYIWARGG
jgi:hypothetical protein